MKKLIFIRHAIAVDREKFNQEDYLRPITQKGESQIQDISKFLKKLYKKEKNYLIISSAALRTKQTADILIRELDIKEKKVFFYQDLYDCGVEKYYEYIGHILQKDSKIIICGHNESLSDFLSIITQTKISMRKGSMAIVEFGKKGEWKNIQNEKGILRLYITPDLLR